MFTRLKKNQVFRFSLLLGAILCCLTVMSCRVKLPKDFKIYLLETRYNDQVRQVIGENGFLESYKYLGGYAIDPKKRGTIDFELAVSSVEKMFPSKTDTGLLSVNLEGVLYNRLKNNPLGSGEAEHSIEQYRLLVSKIKDARPNIRVGIYGFPFTFYYDSQRKVNADNKLDRILELCDYISPSLYTPYPVKETGKERHSEFLMENLKYSLETGSRLNKPVIPFVWHIVHPSNKKYGGEVLSTEEMTANIELIANFTHQGNRAASVIWWESSDAGLQSYFERTKQFESQGLPNPDKNDLIRDYLIGIDPKVKLKN